MHLRSRQVRETTEPRLMPISLAATWSIAFLLCRGEDAITKPKVRRYAWRTCKLFTAAECHNVTSSPRSPTWRSQCDTSHIPSLSYEDSAPDPFQSAIAINQSYPQFPIPPPHPAPIQCFMPAFVFRCTAQGEIYAELRTTRFCRLRANLIIQSSISANRVLQIFPLRILDLKAIYSTYGLFLVTLYDCVD